MMYMTRNEVMAEAMRVTHANFTGEAFDGPPFEGMVNAQDNWLLDAIQTGAVSLLPPSTSTHAVWAVQAGNGEVVLASPGDYIVRLQAHQHLQVCSSTLFAAVFVSEEVYAGSVPEEVPAPVQESSLKPPNAIEMRDGQGNFHGYAYLGQSFDLDAQTVRPATGEDIGHPDPVEGRTYGVVLEEYVPPVTERDWLLNVVPGPEEGTEEWRRAVATAWIERVEQALANGDTPDNYLALRGECDYIVRMKEEHGDTIRVDFAAASQRLDARIAESKHTQWQVAMDDWTNRVWLALTQLNHSKVTDWVGFHTEVHGLLGEMAAEKLPLAWLKTYGIVGWLASCIASIEPGHSELEAVEQAKLKGDEFAMTVIRNDCNESIRAARDWIIQAVSNPGKVDWMADHAAKLKAAKKILKQDAPHDIDSLITSIGNLVSNHYRNG